MARNTPNTDDDFVNDSERPYTDMSRGGTPSFTEQYLRPQIVIPAFLLGVGLLALLYYLGVFQVIGVLVVAVFLAVLAVVVIAYLDNSLSAESADLFTHIDLTDWRTIRAAINNQKNKSSQTPENEDNSEDDDDIYGNDLSPHFGGNSPKQQLEESLEDAKLQIVNATLQTMKTDILNHIDNQRRNSNIQFVLGIIISLVGVSVLVAASLNGVEAYIFSATQSGLAIVSLLFVFVFFTQYSATQQRIKFFQNELTNLNARISAFQLSYLLEEKEAVNEIIKDLTRTERNFKMGKNDQLP